MKKILIVSGGLSKEREISLQTGNQVSIELKKKYTTKICEPHDLLKICKSFKPKVIFNALHGQFGEDGYIQTLMDTLRIPYTHSNFNASAIAMNKEIAKKIFLRNNIITPKYLIYNFKNKLIDITSIKKTLGFPVVIKPKNEGSSVNVFICNEKNFLKKMWSLKNYEEIIIEKFIGGREIQVAIMGKKKLGTIELKPKRMFYDYKAKYEINSKTKHIIPVNLEPSKLEEVENIALKAHKLLGCSGITRSDFKFYNNKFYLLEINTQPGMTKLSLVPEIAKYKKIEFLKLLEWMIKNAKYKI
jgi:D-alanine-D-alanine ligase